MTRNLLTTTALSLLLAGGVAYAQESTTTEPEQALESAADAVGEAQDAVETAQEAVEGEEQMAEEGDAAAEPAADEETVAEEGTEPMTEEPATAETEATEPAAEEPTVAEGDAAEPIEGEADAPMTAQDDPAAAPVTGDTMAADPAAEVERMPVDIASLTAEELIGTPVENHNGERLGSVDDAVLDADGKIQGLVVSFGGFLGFGENTVELTLEEVEFMADEGDNLYVVTNLTPEDLEGRPEVEM